MITKVINVNLHQPIYERLTAKQGDIASRYLLFHLLDGDKPFDLNNRSVRVYAIKPDKTEIFNDLTINDASKGYCTLELTSQCLASAGVVKMELYISQSGKVLTSIPFELEVIACINTANGVTSTNEFSALEVALSSLQDYDNLRREIIQARKGHATVGGRLDNFDSQLDNIEKVELPKLDNKRYKITRPTKKFFDDACVVNINNTGKQAEVCGFRSPSDVSSYADRDSVTLYIDNELPSCVILEVINFTSNSVQVVGDTSSVEIGMIIDCMNQSELDPFNQTTKFSGIVTEVNGQTIKVSGWYQQGNTAEGQVPNKNRIIINPITKGWCLNSNLFLKSDSFAWGGNLAEFGLWNKKSRTTGNKNYRLNGIDMFMYEGYADYLYNAGSLYQTTGVTEVDKGYRSARCNTGYYSIYSKNVGFENNSSNIGFKSSGSNVGFYSENEPKGFSSIGNDVCFEANTDTSKAAFKTTNDGFRVNGMGVIKNLMLNRKIYPTATTLTPNDAFFHIVQQTGGEYALPNPSNYGLCNIKILATSDVILSGSMMTNTGNISTYNLGAWRTVEFYCDATTWIRIF